MTGSCVYIKFFHVQVMKGQPTEFEPVPMDSEDDLFIAYTSGTTNSPKRIVHSQAGYLLYAAFTHKVLLRIVFLQSCQARFGMESLGLRLLVLNSAYTSLWEETCIMATLPHCFGDGILIVDIWYTVYKHSKLAQLLLFYPHMISFCAVHL